MGGFFGVISNESCVPNLFYGTDYHSHLGTRRGGLAVLNGDGITRFIHDITNTQFRSKFDDDIRKLSGNSGIGVISDHEDQPLIIGSHLGIYSIVTVGLITNGRELAKEASRERRIHFSEISGNEINSTELVAMLINREDSFEAGILHVQDSVEGSCSMLILTDKGIYAARDRYGRTPVILGKGPNGYAVTMESCAFPNLGYEIVHELGPGEVVLITPEGFGQRCKPGPKMQICSFLWVYYGYPASQYEGINVEAARYRSGAALARNESVEVDYVCGIPDSGIAHALGYADKSGITYRRPFVKYTPTWPRSFMPQQQNIRDLVAKMKLIPIRELTDGWRLLFCDDSIVRGTQLRDVMKRLWDYGAKELHMRLACPPLVFGCKFLNFSRSSSELDLAARRAILQIEGDRKPDLEEYADCDSEKHCAMVDIIRGWVGITSLKFQRLEDLVDAIGLPCEKLCTYCWNGKCRT